MPNDTWLDAPETAARILGEYTDAPVSTIDEVALYTKALAPEVIEAHYLAGQP